MKPAILQLIAELDQVIASVWRIRNTADSASRKEWSRRVDALLDERLRLMQLRMEGLG